MEPTGSLGMLPKVCVAGNALQVICAAIMLILIPMSGTLDVRSY
jgi:hypothetical protein